MHDLIPRGPALPGALTTAEIDATMVYAEAEKALATRTAYASDWRDFSVWCVSRGATALPAHVGIVAAYLSALADSGRKSSTIGRRAAAIGYHHKMAGHEPPTSSEGVKAVLRHPPDHRSGEGREGAGDRRPDRPDAGALPRQHDRQAGPRAAVPGLRRGAPSSARSMSPISPRSRTDCGC